VTSTQRQGIRLCACPMRRLLTATLLLLLLLPAAHAIAGDNASDLLVDACRDEKVDGTYSQRTYKRALDELPADSDQYTACRDVIERARLAALRRSNSNSSPGTQSPTPSGGGGGSTGGGSTGAAPQQSQAPAPAPTPSRRSTRKSRRAAKPRTSDQPATTTTQPAAEQPLLPTGPVGNVSAATTPLPSSIIVLLAALALFPLLAALFIGLNRVHARRNR
jgi:hypothetical protein